MILPYKRKNGIDYEMIDEKNMNEVEFLLEEIYDQCVQEIDVLEKYDTEKRKATGLPPETSLPPKMAEYIFRMTFIREMAKLENTPDLEAALDDFKYVLELKQQIENKNRRI